MYPNARILCVEPKHFTPEKRETTLATIRDGELDAVIMASSCFERIPLSRAYYEADLKEKKAELSRMSKDVRKSTASLTRRRDAVSRALAELVAAVEEALRPITFELDDRKICLTALMDTGNTLTDPVSGQPVPVAEGDALADLFPPTHRPDREDLTDPVFGMTRLNTGAWRGRFSLLPYRAVGVERGFLLAVRVDRMTIGEKKREGVLVALSPTPVSDGGGYRVLTGGW